MDHSKAKTWRFVNAYKKDEKIFKLYNLASSQTQNANENVFIFHLHGKIRNIVSSNEKNVGKYRKKCENFALQRSGS